MRDVGLDLFVDEWSSYCSTVGVALDFTFPVIDAESLVNTPSSPPSTLPSGKRDVGHSFFRLEFDRTFVPLSSSPLASAPEGAQHPFGPEPPTRAYVHHLLQAHEMTAHVILALHNHLVMHSFFGAIRNLLAMGDGSFESEVERFFAAYEEAERGAYPCVLEAKEEWTRVDRERGKGSLKDKLRIDAEEEVAVGSALAGETEQMATREEGLKAPLDLQ